MTSRKHAHAIYRDFLSCKKGKLSGVIFLYFLIFDQNIDCGYTLETPRQGGSNEYPQSMFWTKNKNKRTIGPVAHLRDHHIVSSWELN